MALNPQHVRYQGSSNGALQPFLSTRGALPDIAMASSYPGATVPRSAAHHCAACETQLPLTLLRMLCPSTCRYAILPALQNLRIPAPATHRNVLAVQVEVVDGGGAAVTHIAHGGVVRRQRRAAGALALYGLPMTRARSCTFKVRVGVRRLTATGGSPRAEGASQGFGRDETLSPPKTLSEAFSQCWNANSALQYTACWFRYQTSLTVLCVCESCPQGHCPERKHAPPPHYQRPLLSSRQGKIKE